MQTVSHDVDISMHTLMSARGLENRKVEAGQWAHKGPQTDDKTYGPAKRTAGPAKRTAGKRPPELMTKRTQNVRTMSTRTACIFGGRLQRDIN